MMLKSGEVQSCALSPALLRDDHLRAHRAELFPQGGVLQLHPHVIFWGAGFRLFGDRGRSQQPWGQGFGRHVTGGGVQRHVGRSLPICEGTQTKDENVRE